MRGWLAAGPASRWPLVLGLVLLGAALGSALWLRSQLVEGQRAQLEGTVRRFEATRVLGRPESPALNFRDLETLAEASENNLIQRIYVVKRTERGAELIVHPFHAGLTNPDWRREIDWLRLPVGPGPEGYLYVQVNASTLNAVDAVLVSLALVLVGGLGVLLLRQRGSEVQISRMSDELAQRQAQVVHLEKLALAGQLSANIFHDIKKPVLNIKHEVEDAVDGVGPTPEQALRVVQEQTELFLEMLREVGMESFVNATGTEREWCDLEETVDRSLKLVRYEQGDVQVGVCFHGDEAFLIEAVPHRLVQIFSNLFLNAFQAMDGTGRLLVRGEQRHGRLIVAVEDSGPGIAQERREELFSPFATTRASEGGSGLGLYITRTLVEEIGGTVSVGRSEELGGAAFSLNFPRPPANQPSAS